MTGRLVADIGGTQARFGVVLPNGQITRRIDYRTHDFPTFSAALSRYRAESAVARGAISEAAIAGAGPVENGVLHLTNAPWNLEVSALKRLLRVERAAIVNDLAAVAYGLPHLAAEERRPLHLGGKPAARARLVVGLGTGLGMATAQSVVREHGGDIDIDSDKEKGSRVSVYLPAAEPSRPDAIEEPEIFVPLSGRVLLADDELLVRSTARRLLRSYGLYVDVAADGQEALETLLSGDFDLAILGDDLRGVTSDRVVGMVKARVAKTRFIISSSRHRTARRGTLEQAGVHTFLRKPFDARTLYNAVVAAMKT